MSKAVIFYDSFLVSGIMCYEGCGVTIKSYLQASVKDLKKAKKIPEDAVLDIDAEPQGLGLHRIHLTVESGKPAAKIDYQNVSEEFKKDLPFTIVSKDDPKAKEKSRWANWINIFINLSALILIIILSLAFPPSLFLTIGLACISLLTTLVTARKAFKNFYYNLKNKKFANMSTSVTLGWILTTIHTLYHSIAMPLMFGLSMVFMSFMMPILLILIINIMDEIKRSILKKSNQMQLLSMRDVFPELVDAYECYELPSSLEESLQTDSLIVKSKQELEKLAALTEELVEKGQGIQIKKRQLKPGLLIKIKEGECFPVDGYIVSGQTIIDASILNGEPKQAKKCFDTVPAGAINLGNPVILYARADSYSSKINELLFRANRSIDSKPKSKPKIPKFNFIYAAIITLSLIVAVVIPLSLSIFSLPFILQNILAIIFSVCFCTIAISHELPKLLSLYQRHQKGIILKNSEITQKSDKIHTVVFDKTGTLTTGSSQVDSSEGITIGLWQRIYLLEKAAGAGHPIAKTLITHAAAKAGKILLSHICSIDIDSDGRGISAQVQDIKVSIGSLDYLKDLAIKGLPDADNALINEKLDEGQTAVYVAEEGHYKGVIFIKHEVNPKVIKDLQVLKDQGIELIMLTGDNLKSAKGFSKQNGNLFLDKNIHAGQTPEKKEAFLTSAFKKTKNPGGLWFVGDALNDVLCPPLVREKGGVSCSMHKTDKLSFFTDMSLGGDIGYIRAHAELNFFQKKIIKQNQLIMLFASIAFLSLVISLSCLTIPISPLISMSIMVATTICSVYNSYRVKPFGDLVLQPDKPSFLKSYMSSNWSTGLLASATILLITALTLSMVVTGGLVVPLCLGLACAGGILMGLFAVMGLSYALSGFLGSSKDTKKTEVLKKPALVKDSPKIYPEKAKYQKLGPKEFVIDDMKIVIDNPSPGYCGM